MTWTKRSDTDLGHRLVELLQPLCSIITQLVEKHLPSLAQLYSKLCVEHRPFGLYHYVTLHVTPTFKPHVDDLDFRAGMSALVPLGDFTGGDLFFPKLNLTIENPEGTILLFDSNQQHQVEQVTSGERFSLSFIYRNRTVNERCRADDGDVI